MRVERLIEIDFIQLYAILFEIDFKELRVRNTLDEYTPVSNKLLCVRNKLNGAKIYKRRVQ